MEPRDAMPAPSQGAVFWAHLDRAGVQSLKSDLRNGFTMFARATPDLAAEYLRAVAESEHNEEIVRSILKLRGTLAQAAPAELADLTARALIARPRRRDGHYGREREEAFTYIDHEFLQASPAQGPFFELLTSSPKDGLALVHRLVRHAVTHGSQGSDPASDVITLAFPGAARTFPWRQTYFWSRQSNYYSVTSALMAVEAWAHRRIEVGEAFEDVLADVLGPPDSCAAYLLVAVDLIISHWQKSLDIAAPFLGCPELLCVDHARQVHDRVEIPDFFGLGALRTEPRGGASAAELKRRPSRQKTLDELIGNFALRASPEQHARLVALLREAAVRLGTPEADAHLGNPEFMVQHAINLSDVSNWQDIEVTLKDGSTAFARQYVSPAAEHAHLQALRDAATERSSDFAMQSALSLAVDDPTRLPPELRSAAIAWARRPATDSDEGSADVAGEQRMHQEAILTAAMIAMRDGDDALRAEHGEWARSQLNEALRALDNDPARQIRGGLRFNPTAIAYTGLIHALRHRKTPDDVRVLLEVAAAGNHAAAHGFGAAMGALNAIDGRLPRAMLRCAFNACVVENRVWDAAQDQVAVRAERRLVRIDAAVAAEVAWLDAGGLEPEWPMFPEEEVRPRRRLRFSARQVAAPELPEATAPRPTEHVNHHAAAIWLRQLRGLPHTAARSWLGGLVKAYMPWTVAANGAGLNDDVEVDLSPSEWNDTFFAAVARCVIGLASAEVNELVVRHILTLPDRNFYDVLVDFLRCIDAVYFEGGDISPQVAVDIRAAFADHMMVTRGWAHLCRSRDLSIEMHLGPAIAVLFFNDHHFGQGSKCYLFEKGAKTIGPFLPILSKLVEAGPSPFVALVFVNLLEVAPRAELLNMVAAAGATWIDTYPDFRQLWVDYGVGRRWCLVVEAIRSRSPESIGPTALCRQVIDDVIAALIAIGVPEATRLEEALARNE